MSQNNTRPPDTSPFLTIAEAADYLRCSTTFLYRAADDGSLRVHRLGKAIRITRADLDALLTGPAEGAARTRPAHKRSRGSR